jgi:hypothetical protein
MELKDLFKLSAVTLALTMTVACSDDKDPVDVAVDECAVTPIPEGCDGYVAPKTQIEIDQETLEADYLAATSVEADIVILTGVITEDLTLTADKVYALRGPVVIGNDNADSAVLTVDPGVTIFGETGNDYLVVSRGSKIEALGTAEAPIIMTSKNDVMGTTVGAGQWGGVVILGNAKSNKCPTDGTSCALQVEGAFEGAVFGGDNDEDDSGTLNYVVVKYAGFEIAPDNELNGITFGGVGSGTDVDYIQVHANADDGVEFFGGTVSVKHLVLTGNQDDSIDWDNGYRGSIQYAYVEHDKNDGEANRGIEADNDGSTPSKTPMSDVMISNLTIVGNNYKSDDKDSEGIYLREGTKASIYNSVITGAGGECFEVEGNSVSQAHLEDGGIVMESTVIACTEPTKDGKLAENDTHSIVDLAAFVAEDGKNNSVVTSAFLANNGVPLAHDDSPITGDDKIAVKDVANMGMLETTTFVGAIDETNDWREGWAFGFGGGVSSVAGCPSGSAKIESVDGVTTTCELSGRITSDLTLTKDNLWALNGPVFVGGDNENSAILTIDAGTTVYGSNGGDYLVVSRGSKIEAVGTSEAPIMFTSKQDVLDQTEGSGQWGGMVILGNAPSNKCPSEGECSLQVEGVVSGGVFGGTNWEDNSGTLNYVVVKNAGFEVAPDNELNGITFAGVGSGTMVDYIQVHANADDGVEFFGGSVNVKHVVLTANKDDSVDWDNGYRGKMQYVLIKHASEDGEANRGIEADNDKDMSKTPVSNPTIANITMIGNDYTSADKDSEGFYFREGTKVTMVNALITNAGGECLEVEGEATNPNGQDYLADGGINITNSVIACTENFKNGDSDVDLSAWWSDASRNNSVAANMAAVVNGIFTIDTTTAADANALHGAFFETTDFIGAVKNADNDWTKGWAVGLD